MRLDKGDILMLVVLVIYSAAVISVAVRVKCNYSLFTKFRTMNIILCAICIFISFQAGTIGLWGEEFTTVINQKYCLIFSILIMASSIANLAFTEKANYEFHNKTFKNIFNIYTFPALIMNIVIIAVFFFIFHIIK